MRAFDSALVAVNGFFLLLMLVWFLRKVWQCELLTKMWSATAAVASYFNLWKQSEVDEVSLMVRAKIEQLQVDNFRWASQALCLGLSPVAVAISFNIVAGRPRSGTDAQLITYIVLQGSLISVLFAPHIVSSRTVDLLYGVILLCIALLASPWMCDADGAVLMLSYANFIVAFMNVARRALPTVAGLNLVAGLSFCSTIVRHWRALTIQPAAMLAVQLLLLAFCPGVARALDRGMAAVIRGGFEMRAAREALDAASALLRSCCDVVVNLTSEGAIEGEALDLGSFLLRGTGHSLQGTLLSELFSREADRAAFQSKLSEPKPSGVGLAEAIHVRARDGNDQLLRLELMLFQFQHLDDQPHFMVGIREFTDAQVAERSRSAGPEEPPEPEGAELGGAEAAAPPEEREASGSEIGSLSAAGEDSQDAELPAVVAVDSHCAGLHVRECSRGFRHRVGRLPLGTCLAPLVQRREDFARWVHNAVNAALYGEDEPPCSVTLCMRQGPVRAQCRLLRPRGAEGALDPERVRLLLFNVRQGGNNVSRGAGSDLRPQMQLKGTPVVHMSL